MTRSSKKPLETTCLVHEVFEQKFSRVNFLYQCFLMHQDLFTLITLTVFRVLKRLLKDFD